MSSRPLRHEHPIRPPSLPRETRYPSGIRAPERSAYTLAHGSRQFRIRPLAFWLLLATLGVMAVWSVTTATYFAFREDVLTRLVARQADMQFGYEDRIAELRAQVDRISSRQLLDQEHYEQKLDQILRRQTALESRANALGALGDVTSSTRQGGRAGAGDPTAKFRPMSFTGKGALLPGPSDAALALPRFDLIRGGGMNAAIAQLQTSLDRLDQRQQAALASMEESYLGRERRIRGILKDLGIKELGTDAARQDMPDHVAGLGGPFVPARAPRDAGGFEQQMQRINLARVQMSKLARTLQRLPVRKPLEGEIDTASGFGVRQDPFNGSPAMHTGLDIHADVGNPVRASAEGTVTAAGWSGGYGRTVDIDHGNGLSTRYAHLSAIDVRVGQTVRTGQALGKVGSTGRSTGSHLHYEIRVRGEPVDPQKFFRAGEKLDGNV